MFDDKSLFISGATGSLGRRFIDWLLERYNAPCVRQAIRAGLPA